MRVREGQGKILQNLGAPFLGLSLREKWGCYLLSATDGLAPKSRRLLAAVRAARVEG